MIKEGDSYEYPVSFTQDQVDAFAKVTGDYNPIHVDQEYARNSIFKQTIVHGFLSGSVFSKVFGVLFPGEGTIYLGQEMKFLAPVLNDKNYTAKFLVEDVNREKHIGIIRTTIEDQDGNVCVAGSAKLKHDKEFV